MKKNYYLSVGAMSRTTFGPLLVATAALNKANLGVSFTDITATTYGIDATVCDECKPGGTLATATMKVGHTDGGAPLVDKNSGVNQGASYTYVANYPFY